MRTTPCPACARNNPAEAWACLGCGASLAMGDFEPAARERHWREADRRAARAHVRRALLRNTPPDDPDNVPEVLVCDCDDAARDTVCSLLRLFGFGVHAVTHAEKASSLAGSHRFVAAFFDIPFDGSDGGAGIALCHALRDSDTRAGGRFRSILVLTAARLPAVERVRAGLAGCDELLIKPLARGDVARVLDQNGVALPADPRQR